MRSTAVFVGDIAQVLHSLNMAGGGVTAIIIEAAERDDLSVRDLADRLRLYRQGYKDALAAVALAFGIEIGLGTSTAYASDPGDAGVAGKTPTLGGLLSER